jgi:magnesium transporter
MMTESTETKTPEQLAEITATGDQAALVEFLKGIPPSEAARLISRMDEEEQTRLLTMLDPEQAAALVDAFPDSQAVELLERLKPSDAAAIVDEMPSDEKADIISELDAEDASAILGHMSRDDARETERLARYDADVAGGIMVTEFLAYPNALKVEDVVTDLRGRAEEFSEYDVQYVYVVDRHGKLVGVLRLRDLLLAPSYRTIAETMIKSPLSVRDNTPLNELADFFDGHGFLGVPVTDDLGRLVGVVRRHDVEEALQQRSGQDFLKAQGIVGGEELRSMPLMTRSSRRLSWLSANIILNVVAASVIAFYQDTLAQVIALAVFLPIISDMSGNAGNQAAAVSMRELTLGFIKPNELVRVWLKEASVGLISGVVLGLLVGIVAWLWKANPYLGLVAGGALLLNTVVAVIVGGSIPLILKKLNRDPALASGPILTTVTDICGFFFVLSFATLLLPYLVDVK